MAFSGTRGRHAAVWSERDVEIEGRDIGPAVATWVPRRDNVAAEPLGPEFVRLGRLSGGSVFLNQTAIDLRNSQPGCGHNNDKRLALGVPVYMVRPGHGGNPARMIAIMRTLSNSGAAVIGVPTPGYDDDDPTQVSPRIRGYAEDHVALIDELAIWGLHGPFVLVGHSMGGGVSCLVAAMRPWQVQRMLLVNAIGIAVPDRSDLEWQLAFASSILHEPVPELGRVLIGVKSAALSPQLAYQMSVARLCYDLDVTPALASIHKAGIEPIVVRGKVDRVVTEEMAQAMAELSGGVLAQFPDLGHGLLHRIGDDRHTLASMVARARTRRLRGGWARQASSFPEALATFIGMVAEERQLIDVRAEAKADEPIAAMDDMYNELAERWHDGIAVIRQDNRTEIADWPTWDFGRVSEPVPAM